MQTIKTKNYSTIRVKLCNGCGDILMDTESINGKLYNIYVGFCGYPVYYAVEK